MDGFAPRRGRSCEAPTGSPQPRAVGQEPRCGPTKGRGVHGRSRIPVAHGRVAGAGAGPGATDRARPGRALPGDPIAAPPPDAAAAPGRDHPLGAVHRRPGQPGDPRALRAVPHRRGVRRGRPARARRIHPLDGVLPAEGPGDRPDGPHGRRTVRRRGAAHDGGAASAPRRRPQDRQRHPGRRLRPAGDGRGHPRAAHQPAVGSDRARRSGEDRARPRRAAAAGDVVRLLAACDLLRP